MSKKSYCFLLLKRRACGVAFNLAIGKKFTFNDLNLSSGIICSAEVQQEIGLRFAYFVKHTPSVPFVIFGKNSKGNLVYLKTGPNPKRQKRNWKGGNN
ncbi:MULTISPECIES: cassette chromosome ssDNA-binding protein [Staphylococcus]|uniref:cassette chromosome ssDNA-binding protein n=1 Tax=Staphylococcus TaxID=1279 RepID=UPI000349C6A7|nr:DUF1413 domain-containing protein [Staphylococcus xylosus]MEB7756437.1 single-stranded DNA-binding protein [Staphylococcus xylosus]